MQDDGVTTLKGIITNEHNFNILGGNMKQSGMKPRTGLILIAIIFIFAGSFDYADELNSQKHAQVYNEQ